MKDRVVLISLAAILLLGLILRLGMGVYLGFNSPPDMAACGADTVEFERMAWSAAQGHAMSLREDGLPTAFRAPGYPLFLAGLYRLFGHTYLVNRVALSAVGVLTCWLTWLLALRLGLSRRGALSAALLVAVLPLQFYYCGHFMSEPLATALNVAACLMLVTAQLHAHKLTHAFPLVLLAGIMCGLSTLVRASSILMPAALGFVWLLSRRLCFRRVALWVVVFGIGMLVVIAPWTFRNKRVLGDYALIATNGGSTFWGANNDVTASPGEKWGTWISTSHVDRERKEREVWSLKGEVAQDRKEWQIGREWVARNPGKLPLLVAGKLYRLLTPFAQSPNRPYVLAVAASWIFLFPVAMVGLILVMRDRELRFTFLPLVAQLLTLLATTIVFYGSERFRAPYEPFLAIYAAVAIFAVFRRIKPRREWPQEGARGA